MKENTVVLSIKSRPMMMETIGTKILEIRIRKGFTQEKLSDLANINLRTLQRIEKGSTEPRSDTLNNICRVLEINLEDILNYGKKDDLKFIGYFHLSVLSCLFFPLGNIILPMILWQNNRHKIANLYEQGANVLNYQILWTLLFYIIFILWFFFSIGNWAYTYRFLYVLCGLYLINVAYPIIVYKRIGKGEIKNYYFNPIKFIK